MQHNYSENVYQEFTLTIMQVLFTLVLICIIYLLNVKKKNMFIKTSHSNCLSQARHVAVSSDISTTNLGLNFGRFPLQTLQFPPK